MPVFFCVKKTFKAMVCQKCGNFSKTISEIMKHYQKAHMIFFLLLNCRSWDFQPLIEKAKPTSLDSSSNKPIAVIRKIGYQPLLRKDIH